MNSRALAPAALLLVFALAGCGGGAPPVETPDDPGTGTGTGTETGSNDGGSSADAPACTRDDVDIAYEATDNTAGQMHGVLTMTNTAPSPCSLDGYPVLYLGSGEVAGPVGLPADPDGTSVPVAFILEPGNVATSTVTITQAGNVEGCDLATTTHFVAAPPLVTANEFAFETDGRHVDIPKTPICYNDDIGLLTVGALTPA